MWTVILENNQIISSRKNKWVNLPNIPILRMYFYLPNKKIILLEGFESYLYFIEIYQFFLGKTGKQLDTLNILAKYNNEVCQLSWHNKGHLLQRKNQWGKEFTPVIWNPKLEKFEAGVGGSTNKKWWKTGLKLPQAKIKLLNNL